MIKFFNYLLISNIFTGAFVFNKGFFDFYVSYLFLTSFLLFYIFSYRKIHISPNSIYILLAVFAFSLINLFQKNNSLPLLLKILFGFVLNGLAYYLLIRLNNNKVEGLFRVYLQIACVVSLIGIFQEISYWIGFQKGYDFRYFIPRTVGPYAPLGILRITSIMQEPAHLGAAMAPALFISILNIMQKTKYFIGKKASLLIIATVLLSFSLISYIGIIVSLILISVNHKKLKLVAVCALILIVLSFGAYKILPEIRVRINDTIAILSGKKPIDKVNLSTFAFYSNGFVACKSFMRNPLFGSGLGSHPLSYDRYISEVINPDNITYALNKEDASGLFLRLVSETGLLGIFIFSYFIFRFYVSRARDGYLWAMSNAIICLFVLNLLRQGNYFYNGFLLFIWLYYFTHRNAQNKPVPL